jgi:GrpB-like predicted nucleotidyltransferase (UPF0157 family)
MVMQAESLTIPAMGSLNERVQQAVCELVDIDPYDVRWPEMFRQEAEHLRECLPSGPIRRSERFGSTAVPVMLREIRLVGSTIRG